MSDKLVVPYAPEHPIVPAMSREAAVRYIAEHGVAGYNGLMGRRNAAIKRSEVDPFNYVFKLAGWWLCDLLLGFVTEEDFLAAEVVPERWKSSESLREFYRDSEIHILLILGGNRAAKTEYMIWRAVQDLVKYPGIEIWVMHQKQSMSIKYHQTLVWKYLPDGWKDAGKGRGGRDPTYVSYTYQNGFSAGSGDAKLTGPDEQTMIFKYYTQAMDEAIQGGNLGSPLVKGRVGAVADELLPAEWFKEMRARISTRAAKFLVGFTPVNGYSDTVALFQDASVDVYSESVDPRLGILSEKKQVAPVVRRCVNPHQAIVNFHTHYNCFNDYEALRKNHLNDSDDEKRIKFYGLTDKSFGARFRRFDAAVHVVKRGVIAEWSAPGVVRAFKFPGTNYLIVDPAKSGRKGKNWAMGWLRVDVYGRLWVYREWPSQVVPIPEVGLLGPWAEPGAAVGHQYDGVPGDGCDSVGFTLADQKKEIARLEQWKDFADEGPVLEWDADNGSVDAVELRYMDSRFANTPVQDHQVNTTLLEQCAAMNLFFIPTFSSEAAVTVGEGADLIADALGNPDDAEQPPRLFISEDCENFIFAMKVWTGMDGQRGATKDWIDILRYALMAQVDYLGDTSQPGVRPGRAVGYGVRRSGDGAVSEYVKRKKGL